MTKEISSYNITIQIGDANLAFEAYVLPHRKINANQILQQSGFNPTLEHRLVELTFPGTKSWDDDETLTFRHSEERYFVVGKLDRTLTFAIDDIVHELPFTDVSEPVLRKIAGVSDEKILVHTRENLPDLTLDSDSIVSLDTLGVERIFTKNTLISVCLDGDDGRKIPRGTYSLNQLLKLFAIPVGYILSYVDVSGKLKPLSADFNLDVFEGIKFFSHAEGGAAS